MSEENKTIQLKDEDLEKVSGGVTEKDGITFKFDMDQRVHFKYDNWVYKIVGLVTTNGPQYRCEIVELPVNYDGSWRVGQVIQYREDELVAY